MPNVPIGTPVTIRLRDFSGGWNPSDSPSLLSDREAHKADNVSYDQRGTLEPMKGRKKRFAVPFGSASVAGLGALVKKDGTTRLVIAAGDKISYDEPHLDRKWDTQGDWKQAGTSFRGEATADRTAGSLQITAGPARQNEKQTVTISGSPTGGTFTLTLSGQTTAALAYNATALQVQTALGALSTVGGTANISTTGNAGGPWTVEFIGAKANTDIATMIATPSLTGGTSPSVSVAVAQEGYNTDITQTTNTDAGWAAGTLSQTQAGSNSLGLSIESASLSIARTSQADFNLGTHSNTSTAIKPGSVVLAQLP
jgi:hypothetical protein